MNSNIWCEPMATFERRDEVLWADDNGEPLDCFQDVPDPCECGKCDECMEKLRDTAERKYDELKEDGYNSNAQASGIK